jgi:hypothetical protein
MSHRALGSVAFFINVPRGVVLSVEEELDLAHQTAAAFEAALAQSSLRDQIAIHDIDMRRGCLITTITLCVAATALYVFVKDYTKLREGVIAICQDVQRGSAALKRWSAAQQIWWYREDIFDPDLLPGAAKVVPVDAARRGLVRHGHDKSLIQKE